MEDKLWEVADGYLLGHHQVFSQGWDLAGLAQWKLF